MKTTTYFVLVLVFSFAFEMNAYAQFGTITDGNATFSFGEFFDDGSASFTDSDVNGGSDNVYQNWWWYRITGDVAETVFPGQTTGGPETESYVGNTANLAWTSSIPLFDASLTLNLQDLGAGARLDETMVITNTSRQSFELNLYNYLDADVGGSFDGDSAILQAPNSMRITDGATFLTFDGPGALAYEVLPYPDLLNLLNDGFVTDLSNSGLPFGPGDWTGAYQWRQTIAPGESFTFRETITIGVIPEPSTLSLMGLLGLAAVYRRRR